jgi:hypothetical protein
MYRIDITDGPIRLVDMTWTGGGTDVDIIRGYCNLVVRLGFFPKSFLLRLDNDLARVMTVIPTSPPPSLLPQLDASSSTFHSPQHSHGIPIRAFETETEPFWGKQTPKTSFER